MADNIAKIRVLTSGRKIDGLETIENDSRFSCFDIRPYSAKERAELLYDAISAKDKNGDYLYNNIYLRGGNGAEDTIKALEELLQKKQVSLPKRQNNLNVWGFSDASQLFHYLGQKGVATPIYYSGTNKDKFYSAVVEVLNKQNRKDSFAITDLTVINNPENKKEIIGYTQPGSITGIEHRPTHQLRPFSDGNNMLIIELTNQIQIDRLKETIERLKGKDISLLLSKDMERDMTDKVKEAFPELCIFHGIRVGHGDCMENAMPIPLFAKSQIDIKNDGKAIMEIQPFADKEAVKLQKIKGQVPKVKEDKKFATNTLIVDRLDNAGRAILSDLTKIKQNDTLYTIAIKGSNIGQKIELGVKELLEYGIINADTVQQLNFSGKCENLNELSCSIIKEFVLQYLPKLEKLTYNNEAIYEKGKPNGANISKLPHVDGRD